MKLKEFFKTHYTHETIMSCCEYNEGLKEISLSIKYCEWQLEEQKHLYTGYKLIFNNVYNIDNFNFFKIKDEFVLDLISKNNQITFLLDVSEDTSLTFNFKDIDYKDF